MKKTKTARAFPAIVLLLLLAASACWAGSIYRRVKGGARPLTADPVARRVGDLLTIVVSERSVIENDSERKLDKSDSRKHSMEGTLDLASLCKGLGAKIFNFPKLDFKGANETKFKGEAEYESDRSFIDEMTVTVHDVHPNGNLVVIGTRTRSVNGDVQIIQMSGIVRAIDISYDNKIKSTRVAQFHIINKMKGQEENATNPGWLSRIANFLSPF